MRAKGGAGMEVGGVTITSSTVNTGGGDIVGRDKIGISAGQLDSMFRPVAQAIEAAPPDQKAAATAKLQELKDETLHGKNANDSLMAKLIEGLVGLVPGAVSGLVGAFASPVLGGISGPVTKYVLDKIQDK